MDFKRNTHKLVESGIGLTVIAALLMAGCGGGGGGGASTTAIPVAGAGNSPFVGVTMRADCANGATGTGVIGTTTPGDGTITVSGTCTPPIKITATGKGKMRPIGAKSDGSEDVSYSTDVNLPISNVLSALPDTTAPATANPVTTLVANQIIPGTTPASGVAAALLAAGTAAVASAQTAVAGALGISADKINDDYRTPEIAAASTRLAEAAAVAVQQVATGEVVIAPADIGTRTLGQYMADKLAVAPAASLNNASGVTAQLGANADAVASARVDRNAANVGNMVAQVELDAGTAASLAAGVGLKPTSVGALLSQVVASSNALVTAPLAERIQETKRNDVLNVVAQMAADAGAALAAASSGAPTTEAQTRLDVAQAAAAQIKAGMDTALAGSAVEADVIAQYKLVANGVVTALASDLASSSTHIFAAPPTVGAAGVATALVGKLEGQVSSITAATAPTDTATTGNYATVALKVAAVMDDLAPPPVVGGAVTTAQVVAYEAALAAMASKMDVSATSTTLTATDLQTPLNNLATAVGTAISGTVVSAGVDLGALAQQAAVAALPPTDFAAPPAIGTTAPVVAPSAPTFTTPPIVPVNAVTQAQIDAAIAAQAQATTSAATAATQAAAAAAAATETANLSTSAATTVSPAQTAKNAAQAAAAAAHTARLAADTAAAAAATAFPNSSLATEAAAQASAAAASDVAAAASASAALSSYNILVERLLAEKLAIATAKATEAATAAATAATQATAAASAAASAMAATTSTAAQTAAAAAAAAATAVQTAATAAAAASTAAAAAGVPADTQAVIDAAASATAAQASAVAAKASSDTAAARVTALVAQEAGAATSAAHAATDATTAATQATAAASAAASAVAATTVSAAQTAATAAQTAATAAQTAATHAAADATSAATQLPGSTQANAAAASATAAQTSATAAQASADAALASYNTLVAQLQAAQLAAAQTAAAHAATDATTASTQATAAATAAATATAATTSAAAQTAATAAATAATAAQTAATHAVADATEAATQLPGSPQATAAAASATAAQTSATAAQASSATAAARVTALVALEATYVCKVAVGPAVAYVSGTSCSTATLSTNGGNATVTSEAAPAGVTPVAYSTLLTCDPFGAPPAAGATTLTACKP